MSSKPLSISSLYIYPIKALRPITIDETSIPVALTPMGLPFDRHFMLCTPVRDPTTSKPTEYKNVHVVHCPRAALFHTEISPREVLTYPEEVVDGKFRGQDVILKVMFQPPKEDGMWESLGGTEIEIPLVPDLERLEGAMSQEKDEAETKITVTMHKTSVQAWNMGNHISSWFSERLGTEVCLIYLGNGLGEERKGRKMMGTMVPGSEKKSEKVKSGLVSIEKLWDAAFVAVQVAFVAYAVSCVWDWTKTVSAVMKTRSANILPSKENRSHLDSGVRSQSDSAIHDNLDASSLVQPLLVLVLNLVFILLSDNITNLISPRSKRAKSSSSIEDLSISDPRISFADCAPYLITSTTSLNEVTNRITDPRSFADAPPPPSNITSSNLMLKFRPSISVSGASEAFDEDFWSELTVHSQSSSSSALKLSLTHNCPRCMSLNIDYATGKKSSPGAEGLVYKALSRDRRVDGGAKYSPVFGRYGFLSGSGEDGKRLVRVGDLVDVTGRMEGRSTWGEYCSSWFESLGDLLLTC